MKGFFKIIRSFKFSDSPLAIDLGTANTLVYVKGKGIVMNEPSVVAIDKNDGSVVSVGRKAKEMLGKTPENIIAARPVRDGVVANLKFTEAMLSSFIASVRRGSLSVIKPFAVVGVPSETSQLEMMALERSAITAGARKAYVVYEPIAAAIGSGLPIEDPVCNMVVDIGGGTTEIAVVSLMGVVFRRSLRVGGDKIDEAVAEYILREYGVRIGIQTAEQLKISLGSVREQLEERRYKISGISEVDGTPSVVEVSSSEISAAIRGQVEEIVGAIRESLEKIPPELSSDLVSRGIVLSGGGALLDGIDEMIAAATGISVRISENPLTTVVRGLAKIVDSPERFEKVLMKP